MNENNPATQAPPPPPAAPAPPVAYTVPVTRQVKSPTVAGVLSIFTGLGHVYLGLYKRAAIFFAIWVVSMFVAQDVGGPIGLFIAFWWFFVLIDAVRQAQAINACCAAENPTLPEDFKLQGGGSLALGVFLILFGAFFILRKFVSIDLEFLRVWWPIVFILFGAWQVWAHFKEKPEPEKPRTDEPVV